MRAAHDNNINALRFIAAAMVIYAHSYVLIGKESDLAPLLGSSIGGIAVAIFFLLSGYLIAKSWNGDKNVWRYFLRRFFRIFPALLVVVLLTMLVLGPIVTSLPLDEYFTNLGTWSYALNALLIRNDRLPGVFQENPYPNAVNGSLWTLTVEALMYIILPLVYSIGIRLNRRKLVLFLTLCLCVIAHTCFLAIDLLHITTLPTMIASMLYHCTNLGSYFFIGTVFYEWKMEKRISVQWSFLAVLLIAVFGSVQGTFISLAMLILLPLAIFPFAICDSPVLSNWFKRDDFSYGLYIYAFPIQQTLIWAFEPLRAAPPLCLFFISGVITLGAAFLSWHFIEKRMLALCRKVVAKRS